jgi:hypothetical protein
MRAVVHRRSKPHQTGSGNWHSGTAPNLAGSGPSPPGLRITQPDGPGGSKLPGFRSLPNVNTSRRSLKCRSNFARVVVVRHTLLESDLGIDPRWGPLKPLFLELETRPLSEEPASGSSNLRSTVGEGGTTRKAAVTRHFRGAGACLCAECLCQL